MSVLLPHILDNRAWDIILIEIVDIGRLSPLPSPIDTVTRSKRGYESRLFSLTRDDYAKCVDFALAMHFRGYVLSDWGTGRQREFGQKVSNWVRGQLGEIGLQYFCRERLGMDIELDFDMHDEIVPQDVLYITRNGEDFQPGNGIAVKASKLKSAYLVLSPNEVELNERQSDVYIFTRIGARAK